MEIKTFDVNEALNGASIGFKAESNVQQYIVLFTFIADNPLERRYSGVGQDDNITYYFNQWGECEDGNTNHQLYGFVGEIDYSTGTVVTRSTSSGSEDISIENMQPREIFAQAALQSILAKLDTPILNIDNFKIYKVCDLAFKIAQEMLSRAAAYRAATQPTPPTPEDIDIDINTVTEVSDKIAYNMANYLKVISENSTYTKDTGIKIISPVEVTVQNTPNVNVSNVVDTNVTNTVDVNVTNFPENTITSE